MISDEIKIHSKVLYLLFVCTACCIHSAVGSEMYVPLALLTYMSDGNNS